MTKIDRSILDSKFPVGKPWVAGREVWVYGLFAGRGRGVYTVARLPRGFAPSAPQMNTLYNEWVRTRITLTEDQAVTICLAEALG